MKKPEVKTITLKVSDNTREKMKEYFEDKKRIKTPPYAVFQADEADTVVTLYESGKVVFQGISADIDANSISGLHIRQGKNILSVVFADNMKHAVKLDAYELK